MAPVPGDSPKTPAWHVDAARGPSTPSFDHLVGAREQRRRHIEAERLNGFKIDDQLVLGRRLHWQVGRLLALEDAVDVAGRAAILVDRIRPVRDQAAARDEETCPVDRGRHLERANRFAAVQGPADDGCESQRYKIRARRYEKTGQTSHR